MIFFGENGSGTVKLDGAIRVEINSEYGVPADDMTVTFSGGVPLDLWKIYAVQDGFEALKEAKAENGVLFAGIVDEVTARYDGAERKVTVYARSMAALLLDNECEPGQYIDPTSDVIAAKHILPFGICECTAQKVKSKRTGGTMTLMRGQSHWAAVNTFCRTFLSSVPRIDFTGRFRTDTYLEGEDIVFDNESGVFFSQASVKVKRCKRISKVFARTSGGMVTVSNERAAEDGIVRERRIDLSDSRTGTLSDADRIIEKGEEGALTVSLLCSGYLGDAVGRGAYVSLPEVNGGRLLVYKTKYVESGGSGRTTVTLSEGKEL